MVVNNKISSLERLKIILKDQHGILLTSDLAKFKIPRNYLSILEQSDEIERVSRGIYKMVGSFEDELFIFQVTYRSTVFSHETTLYLHDLTDITPLSYSITVPVGYHSILLKERGNKIFYLNRILFDLGIISMKTPHGNEIKTTNLERTICDILRSRNQVDIQLVNEGLKRYVRKKEKNIDLLFNYAKRFRIQKLVRETIEVLL